MSARQASLGVTLALLLGVLAVIAPSFFSADNMRDLVVGGAPVLVCAVGMTTVIVTAHVDLSIGAVFAICSVVAGVVARAGVPMALDALLVLAMGALLGACNGALVAFAEIPAIVVTLAAMFAFRDGLRWLTGGAWIEGLPAHFQWFGLSQAQGEWFLGGVAAAVTIAFAWALRNLSVGRAVYATGSDAEAARLIGVRTKGIVFGAFVAMGGLTGVAALLDAVRFRDVQSNAGVGLEMKVIAAVVVGGTSISGGRGSVVGTALGVVLLGILGTALAFLKISPYWEKAVQGAIILSAVSLEAFDPRRARARFGRTAH